MKSLLLSLAILSTTVLHAQQFSLGARTGVGFWRGNSYEPETGQSETKRHTLWEKELFVRYQPGRHFAYEVGFTHFQAEGKTEPLMEFFHSGPPESGLSIRDKYYGLNLRAHYDFSCPKMKKISHFAGVALTPQLHVAETGTWTANSGGRDQSTYHSTVNEVSFGFAVEDMLLYRVTRHIDVHSLVACRTNVNSTLLKHGFTMQLGAAYRF